jgi:hypothetical protein
LTILYVVLTVVAGFEFARFVGKIKRSWLRWTVGTLCGVIAAYALTVFGIMITLRATDGARATGPASAAALTFALGVVVRLVASMLARKRPSKALP